MVFRIHYGLVCPNKFYGKNPCMCPDRVYLSWKTKEFFTTHILWWKKYSQLKLVITQNNPKNFHLLSPKILSQPRKSENLFLYLGVADSIVSFILVKEDEWMQYTVYYSKQTLYDAETRYLKVKKVALTFFN
jgi:hypothetical protein